MITAISTTLFGIQLVATVLFGGGQLIRMYKTRKGVSLTWFVLWEGFITMNLILTGDAFMTNANLTNTQAVIGYAAWAVMIAFDIALILWFGLVSWDRYETITVIIGVGGIVTVLSVAYLQREGVANPWVKGGIALFCKTTSQIVFAFKIREKGRIGLAGMTLVMGHVTVMCRVGQILCAISVTGTWDENLTASLISELGNELSWILVTVCWLRKKPQAQ